MFSELSQSPETKSNRGSEAEADQEAGLERVDEGDWERSNRADQAEEDHLERQKSAGLVQSKL